MLGTLIHRVIDQIDLFGEIQELPNESRDRVMCNILGSWRGAPQTKNLGTRRSLKSRDESSVQDLTLEFSVPDFSGG